MGRRRKGVSQAGHRALAPQPYRCHRTDMHEVIFRCDLPCPPALVRDWHLRAGLDRLIPPWRRVRIAARSNDGPMGLGPIRLAMQVGPFTRYWDARHEAIADGFADIQVAGPFRFWRHEHRFLPGPGGGCRLEDAIAWDGPLPGTAGLVRRALARDFRWRHARTRDDLAHDSRVPARTIAVSGAGGLLGRRICSLLRSRGHTVRALVRRPDPAGIVYDPAAGVIDRDALAAADAVIHLAGASIARRWTTAARHDIRESRVAGTALIARTVAGLPGRARPLVLAGGIGWHGATGDRIAAPGDPSGGGFLASVCRDWEAAAEPARQAGIPTTVIRLGMVVAGDGGALAAMLPAFRLGLGGPLGGGQQWLPWISADDAADRFVDAALGHTSGVLHGVAPGEVRQAAFSRCLGAALRRPAILPAPAWAIRLALGDMGSELLLTSTRAAPAPAVLWRHAGLAEALASELG
jgi:uncharacterized protein